MPRFTREIVKSFFAPSTGVEIVAELESSDGAAEVAAEFHADVVVTVADTSTWRLGRSMRRALPQIRLLAIDDDGRRGVLWELHPVARELDDMSPRALVDAVLGVQPA